MSASPWDPYIDNLMGHCAGACDSATIIGKDGSYWTSQDGNAGKFVILTPEEAKNIAANMWVTIPEGGSHAFAPTGIFINGQKYRFLRFDTDPQHGEWWRRIVRFFLFVQEAGWWRR